MTGFQIYVLASISASQARIAGMQAENQLRQMKGEGPAYGEDAFNKEATKLQTLARQVRTT